LRLFGLPGLGRLLFLALLGGRDRFRLALRDALGVDRLGLLGGEHQLVLDAPAPLGDPRSLADPAAEVIELRPPHVAPGDHLEPPREPACWLRLCSSRHSRTRAWSPESSTSGTSHPRYEAGRV